MGFFGVCIGHAVCSNDPLIAGIASALSHAIPWLFSGVGVAFWGNAVFVFKVVAKFTFSLSMEVDVLGVSAMLETG